MSENTHPLSLYFQLRNVQHGMLRKDKERLSQRREEVAEREQKEGYWSASLRHKASDMQKYLDALTSLDKRESALELLAIVGFNELMQETIIATEQAAVALIADWNNYPEQRERMNGQLKAIGNELLELFDIEQRNNDFISSRRTRV